MLAATGLGTTWVSRQFDAAPPAAWTTRRHMREIVSFVVMTAWMVAFLVGGAAFQYLQLGREPLGEFAVGSVIACIGALPAILLYVRGARERRLARASRPARVARR
ncbi:MAG: hypothetical protein R3D25_15485 [Geminicoccaceae bacterium]